ncbi:MAG: hypothetical protein ACK46X_22460, partial [Candidatus Sericytochromatia bacterium]
EKFIPFGGPDGGDGGRGGSVWAVGDVNLNTLIDYRYARRHEARNGEAGRGSDQYGAAADDIVLRMPVGTVISDLNTGEIVADLAEHDQKVLIAKGGKGGLGNLHFKSSTNRAPRQKTNGEPGEEFELVLDLRVLADGWVRGDTIRLTSTTDSVHVLPPAAITPARTSIVDGNPLNPLDSLHHTAGVAFSAKGSVQLYRFFN